MSLQSRWFGKTDYKKSMVWMAQAAAHARETGEALLMGFEYDCTITLGLRANNEAHGVRGDGVPVIPVSRGGLATLHNEGQAVIYPVVPIKRHRIFAKKWVEILTSTTCSALDFCNIIVNNKNNGVFTPTGKIASIGIDLKGGVSTHGIAVNVSNNLEDFRKIIPCGIAGQPFDRVANYAAMAPEEFFQLWTREFEKRFAPYRAQSLTNTLPTP